MITDATSYQILTNGKLYIIEALTYNNGFYNWQKIKDGVGNIMTFNTLEEAENYVNYLISLNEKNLKTVKIINNSK